MLNFEYSFEYLIMVPYFVRRISLSMHHLEASNWRSKSSKSRCSLLWGWKIILCPQAPCIASEFWIIVMFAPDLKIALQATPLKETTLCRSGWRDPCEGEWATYIQFVWTGDGICSIRTHSICLPDWTDENNRVVFCPKQLVCDIYTHVSLYMKKICLFNI